MSNSSNTLAFQLVYASMDYHKITFDQKLDVLSKEVTKAVTSALYRRMSDLQILSIQPGSVIMNMQLNVSRIDKQLTPSNDDYLTLLSNSVIAGKFDVFIDGIFYKCANVYNALNGPQPSTTSQSETSSYISNIAIGGSFGAVLLISLIILIIIMVIKHKNKHKVSVHPSLRNNSIETNSELDSSSACTSTIFSTSRINLQSDSPPIKHIVIPVNCESLAKTSTNGILSTRSSTLSSQLSLRNIICTETKL